MRFLHTSDWHLGRTIRGRSRIDECVAALDDVVRIALDEGVDAVLIAGDVFDTFSPPSEAQKLLFETLTRLARERMRVVMIAGNHDSAPRMEAFAGILELAGVHVVGSARQPSQYVPIVLPSRDASETAVIVAVPWIPESRLIEYETLFGAPDAKYTQYAGTAERVLRAYSEHFRGDAVNVLMAHMMISGTSVREGSGERKLHIGDLFAVPGQMLPDTAQYIALGHVHKPQAAANAPVAGGAFYAGSLLQLDFGEAEQEKTVRIVDVKPRLPADTRAVAITGGRGLRNLRFKLDELDAHAGRYGDDYLRVAVEIDAPVQSLFERVREVLPNAIDVMAVRTDIPAQSVSPTKVGLEPHELLARYFDEVRGQKISPELLSLFNRMYEEALGATA